MSKVGLSRLFPLLRLDAVNVPDFLALRVLRLAAQTFCQESDYWHIKDSITLNGDEIIELPMDSGVKPCRIVEATLDGEPLDAGVHFDDASRGEFHWLIDAPLSGELIVTQSVKPDSTGTELDENLADDYGEAIVAGALARLLAQPNKPWSRKTTDVKGFDKTFTEGQRKARRERLNKNARYRKKRKPYRFF